MIVPALLLAAGIGPAAPLQPPVAALLIPRAETAGTATVTIISAEIIDPSETRRQTDRQLRRRNGVSLVEFY